MLGVFFSFFAIPWTVVIPVTWTIATFWCYWVFWVGSYGVLQLLFLMDYSNFWLETSKKLLQAPPEGEGEGDNA